MRSLLAGISNQRPYRALGPFATGGRASPSLLIAFHLFGLDCFYGFEKVVVAFDAPR